ncbi:NFACT RNA binding domain-containing protein [uncultured Fibrella sp.]|uniref:NFACT RNA binding domain-containing protein n=1 Tax=uncultured Fibrella sp. TaxID=1284596 RepID=UPI0035CBB64A
MHTNYYFLRQLAPVLQARLQGLFFMECFSQDRDEVVLAFAQARGKANYYKPVFVKVTLRPDFSGLLVSDDVRRARTNSVDLFNNLTGNEGGDDPDRPGMETPGKAVLGVRSFLNERCLAIDLADGYTLLFKFFGNRPNLLIFNENDVEDLFNSKLVADRNLKLDSIDRPIDQSETAFMAAAGDYRKLFPTFGKLVRAYVEKRAQEAGTGVTWAMLQDVLRELDQPTYSLIRFEHHPALSLVPLAEPIRTYSDPIEATNGFFISYNGQNVVDRERADVLRLIDKRLKRARALLDANLQRLISRDDGPSHEELGNLLMANLHNVPVLPGGRSPETITVEDFYRDNRPVTIRLKVDLSPQRNAEGYYRKAKNEKIEAEHLTQQIDYREKEIDELQAHRAVIEPMQSLKELRRYVKQHGLLGDAPASTDPAELFKEVQYEGFVIRIGRNAKNNDLLTQRYAYKDDLWLHARDVSGSHVVVKYKAGKPFPKTVIERAAELAAWYSKRRTDSLCPVIVTPKKFVRKPKGLAEGQVVVEKEDVVLVVPKGE